MSNPQKQSSEVRDSPGAQSRAERRSGGEERGAPSALPRPVGGTALVRKLAAEIEVLKAELAASQTEAREWAARADIDGLLEILNRRGFERELARALAYSQRYGAPAALIYLDLDRFKPINDEHGHPAGDEVLRAAAAALTRSVRASDVVARLGGDEFALLLWNVSPEAGAAKAAALEQLVTLAAVEWNGARLSVGASAGVAMLEPGDSPASVIARADRAMYARKDARRDRNSGDDIGG